MAVRPARLSILFFSNSASLILVTAHGDDPEQLVANALSSPFLYQWCLSSRDDLLVPSTSSRRSGLLEDGRRGVCHVPWRIKIRERLQSLETRAPEFEWAEGV